MIKFTENEKIAVLPVGLSRDVLAEMSDLYSVLNASIPILPAVRDQLLQVTPVARTTQPFVADFYVRPDHHARCFYINLDSVGGSTTGSGWLAVKGTEVCSDDLPQAIQRMSEPQDLLWFSQADHFALKEGKVPLALTLEEAHSEADKALEIQRHYMTRFREPARLPLPLGIVRWPDAVTDRLRGFCQDIMESARATTIINQKLGAGIGSYIYYYPNLPVRPAHIPPLESTALSARLDEINSNTQLDMSATIRSWLQLTARIMLLGYFPCSFDNYNIGQSIGPKNAVLDGGFVDLDSFIPMATIKDPGRFAATYALCVDRLGATLRSVLYGHGTTKSFAADLYLHTFVSKTLGALVEADVDGPADPRLQDVFCHSQEELLDVLGAMFRVNARKRD